MNHKKSHRRFLEAARAMVALPSDVTRALGAYSHGTRQASVDDIPVIDAHIHLFDPTRPQGVPWPDRSSGVLYRPALPQRYRRIAAPLGIRGAIEVECSPWLEDNQWVLDVAKRDTIMVGMVGNLEPGGPEFARQLERFYKNPLFRGIRYGNLWGRNLGAGLDKPQFVADLKLLADAGLVLDTAKSNPCLLADVVRLTDLVPSLRIVVDHLPSLQRPKEMDARATYDSSMNELAKRPQVYVKISEVLRRVDGKVSHDLDAYRQNLDEIFGVFGPDRSLYGSDWPNSDTVGTYEEVLGMARAFFLTKGRDVAEKCFWKNSVAAYRWVRREAGQPVIDKGGENFRR
jgi:predicted TIM-barrel fold metal-dependent hydrolase